MLPSLVRRVWIRVRCTFALFPETHDGLTSHSHFGTDTAGVNTTRRYLCEALSFQYRYVPIGLLECLPPRINDRAPLFRGRDELGGYNVNASPMLMSLTSSNATLKKRFSQVAIAAIG